MLKKVYSLFKRNRVVMRTIGVREHRLNVDSREEIIEDEEHPAFIDLLLTNRLNISLVLGYCSFAV